MWVLNTICMEYDINDYSTIAEYPDAELESGLLDASVGSVLYERKAHGGCWLWFCDEVGYRGSLQDELSRVEMDVPSPVRGRPLQAWRMNDGRLFVAYVVDSMPVYVIVPRKGESEDEI